MTYEEEDKIIVTWRKAS